uniref:Uncharacterized protein n=1 Tax=Rhizophora mucronata TaxID=61149 RepID=A0A2P2IJI5_RHIMU
MNTTTKLQVIFLKAPTKKILSLKAITMFDICMTWSIQKVYTTKEMDNSNVNTAVTSPKKSLSLPSPSYNTENIHNILL